MSYEINVDINIPNKDLVIQQNNKILLTENTRYDKEYDKTVLIVKEYKIRN